MAYFNSVQVALVAQLDVRLTDDQEVVDLTPLGWQQTFVEIDCEIFSMVILTLPLIHKRHLSVLGERIQYWLTP